MRVPVTVNLAASGAGLVVSEEVAVDVMEPEEEMIPTLQLRWVYRDAA